MIALTEWNKRVPSTRYFRAGVGIVLGLAFGPFAQAVARTPDQQIEALIDRGIDQRQAQDVRSSIATLESALAQARSNRLPRQELDALAFLALSYRELPDLKKVLALRLEALSLVRAHQGTFGPLALDEESSALEHLAGAYYLLNDLPNAIRFAREALDKKTVKRTELDEVGVGRSRQVLAHLLYLAGSLADSEKLLRQALADFDTRLRVSASVGQNTVPQLGFKLGALRRLQSVLVAQGRTDEALEIAESGRNQTLAIVAKAELGPLASATPTVAQLKSVAREYQTTIIFYVVDYEFDPDLLVEFSEFVDTPARAIHIWVLRPDGASGFRSVNLTGQKHSLEEMVTDARFSIGARGRGARRSADPPAIGSSAEGAVRYPALQILHELLIAPVQEFLPTAGDSRLMFVPQDLLYLVPFAALQDPAGQYVVSRYATFVGPSVSALNSQAQMLQKSARDGRGVLVVGNPKMPSLPSKATGRPIALGALPHAEKEAKEIAALFAATPILGENATKQAVLERLTSARLVHFATHGLMERDKDRSQYFNAIALTPTRDDDGFLAVREINALRLNAELVVLSACDSADGKPAGDSMLGFSSAFLAAGVPSLIVAQWAIPDAPTALMMREFYGGLLGGMDKARALRQAMLATMKSSPYPGDWAGFTLIGEPNVGPALVRVEGNSPANPLPASSFPLPEGAMRYMELETGRQGDRMVTFMTKLQLGEVIEFYRKSYAGLNLMEDAQLTLVEASTASIVWSGKGRAKVHVSVVDFGDQGVRSVTITLEQPH